MQIRQVIACKSDFADYSLHGDAADEAASASVAIYFDGCQAKWSSESFYGVTRKFVVNNFYKEIKNREIRHLWLWNVKITRGK